VSDVAHTDTDSTHVSVISVTPLGGDLWGVALRLASGQKVSMVMSYTDCQLRQVTVAAGAVGVLAATRRLP
jgi:hypothetical protein